MQIPSSPHVKVVSRGAKVQYSIIYLSAEFRHALGHFNVELEIGHEVIVALQPSFEHNSKVRPSESNLCKYE